MSLPELIAALARPEGPWVVVDGYHGFMAVETDLSHVAPHVFYLAGGYKYAMAGEGVALMHAPPGFGLRPEITGWYAEFDDLSLPPGTPIVLLSDTAARKAAAAAATAESDDALKSAQQVQQTLRLKAALDRSGGAVRYMEAPDAGHNEAAWSARLGEALVYLFAER